MTRTALTVLTTCALALSAMACNPATAKDRTSVWTSVESLDDEGQLFGRAVRYRAGVDAQARDMDTELELTASTTRQEGENPRLDVYRMDNAADLIGIIEGRVGPDARASEGAADVAINPDFRGCEGEGYTQRDDGGCDYQGNLLILGDGPRTLIVGGAVKVWAADEWSGDPDSVQVYLDLEALSVEE